MDRIHLGIPPSDRFRQLIEAIREFLTFAGAPSGSRGQGSELNEHIRYDVGLADTRPQPASQSAAHRDMHDVDREMLRRSY